MKADFYVVIMGRYFFLDLVRIGWILATQFYYITSLKEKQVWRIMAALYLNRRSLGFNSTPNKINCIAFITEY